MAASSLEASTHPLDELVREARVERGDLSTVNAHLGRARVQRVQEQVVLMRHDEARNAQRERAVRLRPGAAESARVGLGVVRVGVTQELDEQRV